MEFEWDLGKSESNLRTRGFDFAFATLIFEGLTVERSDDRRDYGERRVVAIGLADGVPLTVVYTDRFGDGPRRIRRIISARASNTREREAYTKAVEGG